MKKRFLTLSFFSLLPFSLTSCFTSTKVNDLSISFSNPTNQIIKKASQETFLNKNINYYILETLKTNDELKIEKQTKQIKAKLIDEINKNNDANKKDINALQSDIKDYYSKHESTKDDNEQIVLQQAIYYSKEYLLNSYNDFLNYIKPLFKMIEKIVDVNDDNFYDYFLEWFDNSFNDDVKEFNKVVMNLAKFLETSIENNIEFKNNKIIFNYFNELIEYLSIIKQQFEIEISNNIASDFQKKEIIKVKAHLLTLEKLKKIKQYWNDNLHKKYLDLIKN